MQRNDRTRKGSSKAVAVRQQPTRRSSVTAQEMIEELRTQRAAIMDDKPMAPVRQARKRLDAAIDFIERHSR